jgi:hypothetical protein
MNKIKVSKRDLIVEALCGLGCTASLTIIWLLISSISCQSGSVQQTQLGDACGMPQLLDIAGIILAIFAVLVAILVCAGKRGEGIRSKTISRT